MADESLREGWYLMSIEDLECELARGRGEGLPRSGAKPLSINEAIAYRDAGNLPDEEGRTLRLVLRAEGDLNRRRLDFEADYLDPPTWKREGSKPVNIVPLGRRTVGSAVAWWDDDAVGELETEWERSGTVGGVAVPSEYRSFVYRTVIALRKAGREVTVDSILGSVSRWLDGSDVVRLRSALESANAPEAGH